MNEISQQSITSLIRNGSDEFKVDTMNIKESRGIRIGNDVSISAPMTINVETMNFLKQKVIGKKKNYFKFALKKDLDVLTLTALNPKFKRMSYI